MSYDLRQKLTEPILTSDHPVAQCVDLRKTFGDRYRYEWDPAYEVERPEYRSIEAPWLTRIPCRHGRIFPWGDRQLAAYCAAGAVKRKELEALPCRRGRAGWWRGGRGGL